MGLCRAQEYLLARQDAFVQTACKRNNEFIQINADLQRENHKLRKELEGYKRGKLWTIFASFLPTIHWDWTGSVELPKDKP